MQTKLTLRLEENLIARAKIFAKRKGKSVSQLVADYFALLGSDGDVTGPEMGPVTRSLRGVLCGSDVDERDYRKHIEDKYL